MLLLMTSLSCCLCACFDGRYSIKRELEGPVASSAEIAADGKSVVVTFDSVGEGGIDLRSEHGFSLCPAVHAWSAAECYKWGNGANFVNSTSTLGSAPNQVLLAIPSEVATNGGPVVVMYEWNALPCNWPSLEGCGVYSKEAGPVKSLPRRHLS